MILAQERRLDTGMWNVLKQRWYYYYLARQYCREHHPISNFIFFLGLKCTHILKPFTLDNKALGPAQKK